MLIVLHLKRSTLPGLLLGASLPYLAFFLPPPLLSLPSPLMIMLWHDGLHPHRGRGRALGELCTILHRSKHKSCSNVKTGEHKRYFFSYKKNFFEPNLSSG